MHTDTRDQNPEYTLEMFCIYTVGMNGTPPVYISAAPADVPTGRGSVATRQQKNRFALYAFCVC